MQVIVEIPSRHHRLSMIGRGFARPRDWNSCYINAVLQALIYTPHLFHHVQHHIDAKSFDRQPCTCVIHSLYEDATRRDRRPQAIYRGMTNFAPGLRRGAQHDAHEFWQLLLAAMRDATYVS